jgi:hypothetical protein
MVVCEGWAIKTGPCTVTFNDLLCFVDGYWSFGGLYEEKKMVVLEITVLNFPAT